MRTALAIVLAFDLAIGATDVALAIGQTTPPPSGLRSVIDPPGPFAHDEAYDAAHFCIDRVLSWKVKPSVKDAKRELNWCYNALLPRA